MSWIKRQIPTAEMPRAARVPGLGSEYDNFLYAEIGAEPNGTLLSVLSVLARLNLDPWREAASLAQSPGEAAVQRLASLIAAIPDGPSVPAEPKTTAARLIALLPRRPLYSVPPRQSLRGFGTMTRPQAIVYAIIVLAMLVYGAVLLTGARSSPAPNGISHTSASSTTEGDTKSSEPKIIRK